MKLSKESRAIKNAYLREWRKKNPGKVKKHNITYWEKKSKEAREQADKGAVTNGE